MRTSRAHFYFFVRVISKSVGDVPLDLLMDALVLIVELIVMASATVAAEEAHHLVLVERERA